MINKSIKYSPKRKALGFLGKSSCLILQGFFHSENQEAVIVLFVLSLKSFCVGECVEVQVAHKQEFRHPVATLAQGTVAPPFLRGTDRGKAHLSLLCVHHSTLPEAQLSLQG